MTKEEGMISKPPPWEKAAAAAEKRALREAAREQAAAERRALKEERSKANREAWLNSPRNANSLLRWRYEKEDAPLPEIVLEEVKGSASLAKLRAVMADPDSPIFRRLDAADVIIDYELAPGAAANVPPEKLASSAFQFYRQCEADPQTPEALKFRALKAIARIENSRKQAAQSPEAHFANREFVRRQVNAARSQALREAGVWQKIVTGRKRWALSSSDDFDVPELANRLSVPADKIGVAEYLDACNRRLESAAKHYAECQAILRTVRATNRVDNWDHLLGGDHA